MRHRRTPPAWCRRAGRSRAVSGSCGNQPARHSIGQLDRTTRCRCRSSRGLWHGLSGRHELHATATRWTMVRRRGTRCRWIQSNIDLDWGNAAFDVRHVISAGFTYDLPAWRRPAGRRMAVQRDRVGAERHAVQCHHRHRSQRHRIRDDRPNLVGDPFGGVTQPTSGQFVAVLQPGGLPAAGRRNLWQPRAERVLRPGVQGLRRVGVQDHEVDRWHVASRSGSRCLTCSTG